MLPTPVPPTDAEHKPDLVESLQQSDLKRWSPRRAGLPPLFDWWPSYVALGALAVLGVVAASRLVVETLVPFAHVVLVFSLAAALTFAIAPLVGRLEDRMPRPLAVALVFVALIVSIAAFGLLVARPLTVEGQALADRIKEYSDAVQGRGPLIFGGQPLPAGIQDQIRAVVEAQGPDLAARSAGLVVAFLAVLVDLAIVLVVTFYLLLDARRFRVLILRTLEPPNRAGARRVFNEIARVFGAYIRSQLIVALSLAALVSLALIAIGVPYALLLGAFAGIVELVPMLGPFLGAVPALLIASTLPFPTVLWTAIAFVVIQQVESNVLVPRLTGNAVGRTTRRVRELGPRDEEHVQDRRTGGDPDGGGEDVEREPALRAAQHAVERQAQQPGGGPHDQRRDDPRHDGRDPGEVRAADPRHHSGHLAPEGRRIQQVEQRVEAIRVVPLDSVQQGHLHVGGPRRAEQALLLQRETALHERAKGLAAGRDREDHRHRGAPQHGHDATEAVDRRHREHERGGEPEWRRHRHRDRQGRPLARHV